MHQLYKVCRISQVQQQGGLFNVNLVELVFFQSKIGPRSFQI